MGEESPKPSTSTPTGAVFLSYASQDAEAAKRICEALRAAAIEVWFDQRRVAGWRCLGSLDPPANKELRSVHSRVVAGLTLDKHILGEVVRKKL
jgi:hypothetical protein